MNTKNNNEMKTKNNNEKYKYYTKGDVLKLNKKDLVSYMWDIGLTYPTYYTKKRMLNVFFDSKFWKKSKSYIASQVTNEDFFSGNY